MTRTLSRVIVAVLLFAGVAVVWLGGGWAWRQLLRLHGVH
jgi:hypothetical protein